MPEQNAGTIRINRIDANSLKMQVKTEKIFHTKVQAAFSDTGKFKKIILPDSDVLTQVSYSVKNSVLSS